MTKNHTTTGSLGKEKCFGFRRHSLRAFLPWQTLLVYPVSADHQRICIRQKSVKEVINNTPKKLHHYMHSSAKHARLCTLFSFQYNNYRA